MQSVKVLTKDLLAALEKNRESHRQIFLEAQVGYRAQVIVELEKMLAEARDGKRIRRSVSLPVPVDQTDDYDRAIAMVRMTIAAGEAVIDLTQADFACYVLDRWSWRHHFVANNRTYSQSAAQLGEQEDVE